ncbi:MAG: flagellar hook-associated protein FlgL [Proteobacteria bacterium]|nr:flagellar hook-associated protein FlgL [Pseudomonadota bacterium]
MRISTNTLYQAGSAKLSELQAGLLKTQQQVAAGRRMLTPADDPVGAARALEVTQSQSVNTQYGVNRANARDSLAMEESVLQSVTGLIQDLQTSVVEAGNASLDDTQRKFLASELSGRFNELMGLANSRDNTGNYLFAGFQSTSQPFVQTATGANYAGDQGQRLLQVDATRQMAMSDAGDAVFMHKTGNGSFVTAATGTNTGNGVIDPGSITNTTLLTGHNYSLTFTVAAGVTTYDVVDTTTATTVSSGNPYTSGQSIGFDGLQFDIKGAPANGDSFTVAPSNRQDIFTTLRNLINVLNTPASSDAGKAALTNGLNKASMDLAQGLDNVLTVRATTGARLKELDSLDNLGSDKDLQFSSTLSGLQDLDYNKAITQLTQQSVTLQAAQQSFMKITGLSLFDYLR